MQPIARLILPAAAALLLALAAPCSGQEAAPGVSTAPTRQDIEHRDRWDTRAGMWLWGVGAALCGLIIVAAYAATPDPVDKVTKIVGTHASGVTVEEL